MATSRRPLQDGEIRITQSHLAALSVVWLVLSVLWVVVVVLYRNTLRFYCL